MKKILSPALLIGLAGLFVACSDNDSPTGSGSDPGLDFSGLRVEAVTATSAIVMFATSRPTTCEAEYGISKAELLLVAANPDMGENEFSIDHEIRLEDLQPATTYYYRAHAVDPQDPEYRSSWLQFTTPEAPAEDTSLINAALPDNGSSVTDVSSNFGGGSDSSTWGANNAFDDQMGTEWATDGDGDAAALTIDFGRERQLIRFEFRSRAMGDGSAIITSIRLVIDAGRLILGPFETPDPDVEYSFDFEAPVTARTVRVEAVTSTGGNTGAREIRFYSLDD